MIHSTIVSAKKIHVDNEEIAKYPFLYDLPLSTV